MNGLPVLTLDVDWAPDWMVQKIAQELVEAGVKATWFATHPSEAMDAILQEEELFEVGIHPNFFPGGSQGKSVDEVLQTLKSWFPQARSVRCHSLYQSERHLQKMVEEFGLERDCSLYLPGANHLTAHSLRYSPGGPLLRRIPHFYQDNMDLMAHTPLYKEQLPLGEPGLKVLNFHPIHLLLNSKDMEAYERLKKEQPLGEVTPQSFQSYVNEQRGVHDLFSQIITQLKEGKRSLKVEEL